MLGQKMSYKAGHKLGLLFKSTRALFERLAIKLRIPAKYGEYLFIAVSIIVAILSLYVLFAIFIVLFVLAFLRTKTHSDDSDDTNNVCYDGTSPYDPYYYEWYYGNDDE
ncbi:hypothetical protein ACLS0F_10690 [Avibacterium endocarditidis]|uniref:DUF3742 domain-containing protein n=1 Tax=Avibacterium endocarditidis TaxID=380674 RepID=A0ABX4ZUI0_9PAST|nr:hypothetical protein [Avibacterium endocarditidis]POY43179.1 hypothetical protein C3Z13_00415 [Avibacterium endocarditidis]